MKTAYIVTTGEYSDYRICAVFSTRAAADAMCAQFADTTMWRYRTMVEEYPVDIDEYVHPSGLYQWRVEMKWNGDVRSCGAWVCEPDANDAKWSEGVVVRFARRSSDAPGGELPMLRIDCLARNREHAIKIANEKRAMLIANGEGPL